MDELDLDISHYDLNDLLSMFHLDHRFSTRDLRVAFKVVASVHPDKSGLPSEYFLFFKKAYTILLNIHKSKQHTTTFREDHNSDEHARICEELNTRENFPAWFNKMYDENVDVHDEDRDTGYGDWLKEHEQADDECNSVRDMHECIEERKKKCRELAVSTTVSDFSTNNGANTYDLSREKPAEYTSDVFSKLRYEDLRKAHTETVIPVTEADLQQHRTFGSADEMIRYREKQNIKPQSKEAAQIALNKSKVEQDREETRRLYRMLKQDEEYNKANDNWWSKVKQITGL